MASLFPEQIEQPLAGLPPWLRNLGLLSGLTMPDGSPGPRRDPGRMRLGGPGGNAEVTTGDVLERMPPGSRPPPGGGRETQTGGPGNRQGLFAGLFGGGSGSGPGGYTPEEVQRILGEQMKYYQNFPIAPTWGRGGAGQILPGLANFGSGFMGSHTAGQMERNARENQRLTREALAGLVGPNTDPAIAALINSGNPNLIAAVLPSEIAANRYRTLQAEEERRRTGGAGGTGDVIGSTFGNLSTSGGEGDITRFLLGAAGAGTPGAGGPPPPAGGAPPPTNYDDWANIFPGSEGLPGPRNPPPTRVTRGRGGQVMNLGTADNPYPDRDAARDGSVGSWGDVHYFGPDGRIMRFNQRGLDVPADAGTGVTPPPVAPRPTPTPRTGPRSDVVGPNVNVADAGALPPQTGGAGGLSGVGGMLHALQDRMRAQTTPPPTERQPGEGYGIPGLSLPGSLTMGQPPPTTGAGPGGQPPPNDTAAEQRNILLMLRAGVITHQEAALRLSLIRRGQDEVVSENAAQERGKALGQSQAALPSALRSTGSFIQNIDALIADPTLREIVGYSPYNPAARLPNRPHQQATAARIEQVQGQAFLAAYEALRGAGNITEVEGAQARAAIARLGNLGQTHADYIAALNDARREVWTLMNLARTRAGVQPLPYQSHPSDRRGTAGAAGTPDAEGWITLPNGVRIRERP